MNFFLDTEFIEGTQNKYFLDIPYGSTVPTIDLISIGIVSEDGREYYAISKDFNLKEAWNRWQQRTGCGDLNNLLPKEFWIKYNVLKPIWQELREKIEPIASLYEDEERPYIHNTFSYNSLKELIEYFGKTNKEIAKEVIEFVYDIKPEDMSNIPPMVDLKQYNYWQGKQNIAFYGYYSAYDWVVFCWLFGKMIDLPKDFPMYCNDLKQMKENSIQKLVKNSRKDAMFGYKDKGQLVEVQSFEDLPDYPKQTNEHNALADAKWNFELYKYLTINEII